MFKTLMLAGTALAVMTGTASADYYVVQEKSSRKCKVVETRPTETTWVQIGPAAFGARGSRSPDQGDLQGAELGLKGSDRASGHGPILRQHVESVGLVLHCVT